MCIVVMNSGLWLVCVYTSTCHMPRCVLSCELSMHHKDSLVAQKFTRVTNIHKVLASRYEGGHVGLWCRL
jgi:hypothetical protein